MRFLIVLIGCSFLHAQDTWPRFRGEGGRGVSEVEVPVKLDESTRRWAVKLPGPGSSSPVVWKNHLFITSEDTEKQTVTLSCLDSLTGKPCWEAVKKVGQYHMHRFNNTAAASPVANENLVVLSWFSAEKKMCMLSAFDHAGEELWEIELGAFKGKHGPALQPELHEGSVLMTHLHQDGGYVGSFDCKTGETIWKTPYPGNDVSYVTPVVHQGEVIVAAKSIGVRGLDFKTGKETWALPGTMKARTIVSPFNLIGKGGEALFAVGCKNGVYFAVRPGAEPEIAWRMKGKTPYVPTPVSDGATVFSISDGGSLTALNARTGKVSYTKNLKANFYASPLLLSGKLYALTREGEMVVSEVSGDYKELARSPLKPGPECQWADATPAVANDGIYVRLGARMDFYSAK
ncbi:MAG: PQQ-binding-like beta-propeller repeat protein [Akkermansiaceae bacterium]